MNYLEKLRLIKSVKVPRLVFSLNFIIKTVSIHGFCDASLHVYATVVYVRSCKPNGVHVTLLTSKTKVAPIKGLTIPRLELLSCLLLSELMKITLDAIDQYVVITDVKYWTDSGIALA